MRDSKTLKKIDMTLIAAVFLLAFYGLLIHYGLSTKTNSSSFNMQLTWFFIGAFCMLVLALFSFHQLKHYVLPIFGVTIFLLLAVYVVGHSSQGASRWLQIGFIRIQPSEFAKLVVIIALASFLADRKGVLSHSDLVKSFILVAVPALLVFKQPDLGTALVISVIWLGAILVSGVKPLHLLVIFLIGLVAVGVVFKMHLLKQYQINRLLVFVNPNLDTQESGYNLLQSKIAVGSGGLAGKGLFSGSQANLRFIPAANTDFIFAVLGEKLGFAGAIILILLYFFLLSRAISIALTADNYFGSLLALSIATMWLFQIFVNIGMTIGIMPITGIPLPFISYGGSALLTNMISAGILLNIYSRSIK